MGKIAFPLKLSLLFLMIGVNAKASNGDIYSTRFPGFASRDRIKCADALLAKNQRPDNTSLAGQLLAQPAKPPTGRLTPLEVETKHEPPSVNRIVRDETGETYYLVADGSHPELQTGASVISAWIYRHFGLFAPDAYIVEFEGKRFAAIRTSHAELEISPVHDSLHSLQWDVMRVVAAFLQNEAVLSGRENLQTFVDGSLAFINLFGTLGSESNGEFKPGTVFSEAIGTFAAPNESTIYGKRGYETGPQWTGAHPLDILFHSFGDLGTMLKGISPKALEMVRESFRTLDSNRIEEIVDRAQFHRLRDRYQMIQSLRIRRDAYFEYLAQFLDPNRKPEHDSFWAAHIPESDLSFDIRDNRSPQIGIDIQAFVRTHKVAENHLLLFRGQKELTSTVYSPSARDRLQGGQPILTREKIDEFWDQILQSAKMSLNWSRDEARKYALIGSGEASEHIWWDRANPLDKVIDDHSKSNGHDFLVSATRTLSVASRWVEEGRFPTIYRYVYILDVPTDKTVPITRSLLFKHGTNRESEVGIVYDASPYVVAVYDTFKLKFVKPGEE